ncbi:PadR family transcriptional regulator [Actinokineospora enzanensis]|uniref:PadR family transcriptional regulator n=1 Tax=Actinokineospora enzanensis TaxID=155975 RepID=UPI000374B25E|nr:PadR family transcriptional regulator [Actinokineospora enzanensis]
MSAARMLALGVVHWAKRAHMYQIRAELLSWRADDWARVKPGSLYHALRKAVADGLLVDSHEPGHGGPDRTVYTITGKGRAELERLVTNGLREPGDPFMLNAAIAMLPILDSPTAARILRERVAALHRQRADLDERLVEPVKPAHVAEQFQLWAGNVDNEIAWANRLIDKLDAGTYATFEPPES